jgi:hypothetical protein
MTPWRSIVKRYFVAGSVISAVAVLASGVLGPSSAQQQQQPLVIQGGTGAVLLHDGLVAQQILSGA